ncbi:MAG: TonB-dependent receptor [Sphingomonadales bacterium]|nr:MAG: TonB-dependent receptor [Sphingomonadales bacterium]
MIKKISCNMFWLASGSFWTLAFVIALPAQANAQDLSEQQTAQEQGAQGHAEQSQDGNDIIVTATRRAQTVKDVPFNIQAISGDMLEKSGATDIADFARSVPGLSVTDRGPRGGVILVLRGLRTGSEGALAPTTTVYVDEVPMDLPYRASPLDLKLIDMERVEVLRGPQGTLFGGAAIGGTIRYISKKPDMSELEGRASAELSSTDHGGANYSLTGMINIPLAAGVALRANVGRYVNDGYIDNIRLGSNNVNDDRTTSVRVALLLQPTDRLDIALTYQTQRARYGDLGFVRESQPPLTVQYAFPGDTRFNAALSNLTATYDFEWAKLTSSTSYVTERFSSSDDDTFTIRDVILGSFLPPEAIPEFDEYTERRARSNSLSQEVRLVSDSAGPFNWIVGGYYNKVRLQEKQQEYVPVPFPRQDDFEQNIIGAELNDDKEYTFLDRRATSSFAAFGELKYDLTDAWQASIGGRYFQYRGSGTFYSIDQWFGPDARDANGLARTEPLDAEYSRGKYSEKGSVFRFNTSYKFDNDALAYVTIAQGFRPGGFNLLTPNSGIPAEGRQFNSDNILSYEVGGKFALNANRIYVSADIFHIDWSDIQTTVFTPLGFPYRGNAGKAVSNGAEVELQIRDMIARGLSFNVGYSYTDAKLTQSAEGIGFKGERAPLVPQHNLSLMADYETSIGGDFTFGFNWLSSYTGGSYADFGPFRPVSDPGTGALVAEAAPNDSYLRLRGYWLSNASVRIEGAGWTIRAFVDNLFNKQYKDARSYQPGNSLFSGPDVSYNANRPRTAGLEVTKTF